jgi:hypothetical protein
MNSKQFLWAVAVGVVSTLVVEYLKTVWSKQA